MRNVLLKINVIEVFLIKNFKKLFVFIFLMLCVFIININVYADSCSDCAAKGTPCGLCGRSCAINKDGKCMISETDQKLWNEAECAEKATTRFECEKCDGYIWDSGECIPKGRVGSENKKSKVSKVSCGNITDIPKKIPQLTSEIVTIIEILVPVLLVIMGSIDLFKGMTSGKEDELKKGQKIFIKRLIIAAIVFFIFVITKFVISLVADSTTSKNISGCMDCFLNGKCEKR